MPPVEPQASRWNLPDPGRLDGELVGVGADLEPGTLLAVASGGQIGHGPGSERTRRTTIE